MLVSPVLVSETVMAVRRTGTGELLCGQSSSTPMPYHSTINAFKVHKCIQSMHFIQFVVLEYVTGLTVIVVPVKLCK